jgi:hypothetical protein
MTNASYVAWQTRLMKGGAIFWCIGMAIAICAMARIGPYAPGRWDVLSYFGTGLVFVPVMVAVFALVCMVVLSRFRPRVEAPRPPEPSLHDKLPLP